MIDRRNLLSGAGASLVAGPAFAGPLDDFVRDGHIAGAVSIVRRNGRTLALDCVGVRDLAAGDPMRPDTLFQIMSQSKPYIATAVMMLHENGLLNVARPVADYLPAFNRAPTLEQVLSHTSGIPDSAPATRRFADKMTYSLADQSDLLAALPLDFEPGSRWRYSNQGIAVAARVVEVVSGKPYEAFVRERIFAPLDMKNSSFRPARDWKRLASAYVIEDGKLVEMAPDSPGGGDLKLRVGTRNPLPEAGIFSTAEETTRLHELFLGRGRWRGRRLLSEAAVARMLTPRIAAPGSAGAGPSGWQGLGWRIQTEAPARLGDLPKGAFHHSGALGSLGWGDPTMGTVGVLLLQQPGAAAERRAFIASVAEMNR